MNALSKADNAILDLILAVIRPRLEAIRAGCEASLARD
jgi:hypothetical protein